MIKANEVEEKIVCGIFNVKDTQMVSKQQLIKLVARSKTIIDQLIEDLFCENPYHARFKGIEERILAPMRIKRIERLSNEGKKKVNDKQTS